MGARSGSHGRARGWVVLSVLLVLSTVTLGCRRVPTPGGRPSETAAAAAQSPQASTPAAGAAAEGATTAGLIVKGTDAIYLAGRTDVTIPPLGGELSDFPLGRCADQLVETFPTALQVRAGATFSFSAAGSIEYYGGTHEPVAPDGKDYDSDIESLGDISGYRGPAGSLVGVFLGEAVPSGQAPPAPLDLSREGLGASFERLEPALKQVFFIGDGRSAGGAVQTFVAPKGATRLFLGIADAASFAGEPGCYDDNQGHFEVQASGSLPIALAGTPAAQATAAPSTLEPTEEPEEPEETQETEEEPAPTVPVAPVAGPGFTLSSNPDNDLLFYVTTASRSRVYYHGLLEGGVMQLTHVVLDDGSGELAVIIFDERFLPVQWILSTRTIAVYPTPEEDAAEFEDGAWFDPRKARHVTLEGDQERELTADIQPGDLEAIVDEMEAASGLRFEGARAFLAGHDVTWSELAALARRGGPDQPLYIAAATGFSSGAAALGLEQAGAGSSAGPRTAGVAAPRYFYRHASEAAAGALGGVLADLLGKQLDPGDGPAVGVLLCRGAAKYDTCHYMFFYYDRLDACLQKCVASLGCFTDICMPKDISAEMALDMRSTMAGR